jgi:signal transduction histidine kinase
MHSTESQLLKNAFQEFVKASDSLSSHYVVLEERINQLNRELSEKNRELEKMRERLERDERLAAMGEMAARIAHEIKNPLGSMKLYLSMVLRGKVGDKEKDHVNSVVFGINTIDRIINNLLSYTRPKTIVPREACLSQVVKETLDFMSISIGSRDIAVDFSSSYDEISWFDPDLIRLPLMNFISNGIEAIGSGGKICVTIRQEGRHVVAEFADSGQGMSEETRKNVFNPFFTTKDKGVGLGLFIAHNIIKAHGGYIEVESVEGKGSSFTVYLPKERG